MNRRRLLACAAAAAMARPALAQFGRIVLDGSLEQSARVVGHAGAGTRIFLDGRALSATPSGDFVFGLAYDGATPVTLVAAFADGAQETRTLMPKPRAYEEQRIEGLQPEYVSPPEDILARIKSENEKIHAACAYDSPLDGFAGVFAWPVFGILSSWFGSRRILNGVPKAPHMGVDVAAPEGSPIRAPAPGVVRLAEPAFYLTGGTTVVDHGHGLFTAYYHQCAQKVAVGQTLDTGDVIGLVGKTGRATGPHLHWSMNWFAMPLDPSRATAYVMPPRA